MKVLGCWAAHSTSLDEVTWSSVDVKQVTGSQATYHFSNQHWLLECRARTYNVKLVS